MILKRGDAEDRHSLSSQTIQLVRQLLFCQTGRFSWRPH